MEVSIKDNALYVFIAPDSERYIYLDKIKQCIVTNTDFTVFCVQDDPEIVISYADITNVPAEYANAKDFLVDILAVGVGRLVTNPPVILQLLIDETNKIAGSYYAVVDVPSVINSIFQYKLIAAVSDSIELQFWGTVYYNADNDTDDDWVNITEFFTEVVSLVVTNASVQDLSIIDSNCAFAKIRVTYIVTSASPANTIKVGWNTNL